MQRRPLEPEKGPTRRQMRNLVRWRRRKDGKKFGQDHKPGR